MVIIMRKTKGFNVFPLDGGALLIEQQILSYKDPQLSYAFARWVVGADVKKHEQVILDSGNLEWNLKFAKDVEGADIKSHEKIIIDSRNPEWCFRFATEVKDANLSALIKAIGNTGDDLIEQIYEKRWKLLGKDNEKSYYK